MLVLTFLGVCSVQFDSGDCLRYWNRAVLQKWFLALWQLSCFHLVLSAAIHLSIGLSGVALSWRGWNGVRTLNNQMPSGSRSFIRDHGHLMKNMMLHPLRTLTENGGSSMLPTKTQSVGRSSSFPASRASRGNTPVETVGVSEPYRPVNPSDSDRDKASPIFEVTED